MNKAMIFLLTGAATFLTASASGESLKLNLTRPAVIDGRTFTPGTYYVHTPAANEPGTVLIVNAATGAEFRVSALRTPGNASKTEAVFARQGREDRLKAIRTRSGAFEFLPSEVAKAE